MLCVVIGQAICKLDLPHLRLILQELEALEQSLSNPTFIDSFTYMIPDNKVHGDNMGPIWGRQDPGGPHVGPMNLAIWDVQ